MCSGAVIWPTTGSVSGCILTTIAEMRSSSRDQMATSLKYLLSLPLGKESLVTLAIIEAKL